MSAITLVRGSLQLQSGYSEDGVLENGTFYFYRFIEM